MTMNNMFSKADLVFDEVKAKAGVCDANWFWAIHIMQQVLMYMSIGMAMFSAGGYMWRYSTWLCIAVCMAMTTAFFGVLFKHTLNTGLSYIACAVIGAFFSIAPVTMCIVAHHENPHNILVVALATAGVWLVPAVGELAYRVGYPLTGSRLRKQEIDQM